MSTLISRKANTDYRILEELERRWSPRSFDLDQLMTDNDANRLFEAARWAPSSYNAQPWEYIYALRQDKPGFDKLLNCLNAKNQSWAKNAAMLILAIGRKVFEGRDRENRHAYYDLGQANFALTTQAMSMNLYVHQMGGFDLNLARDSFGITEQKDPVVMLAIGHLGSPDLLPETLADRELTPSTRKPQTEFVKRLS